MVEGQQSVKAVLSFGAKSVDPATLEQSLAGREKNAEHLFNALEGIVKHGNNQQILVVAQRGMGKTHLLRLLYHRCQEYINQKRLVVAYFSEEEYGVSDFFDFLVRTLHAFIRWNPEDLPYLDGKIKHLHEAPPSAQASVLEKIIGEYVSDKPLLIIAENFADLLNGMGTREQGRLRAWLYENRRVSIIASSQASSDDFDKENRPFYGFFQLYYLKSISYNDSINFLISLARLDDRPDIVEYIGTKGKAQVKAIYHLVKGNHRLLVTFYEFLKSDTLARLSTHFIKTINDLKPYYETYIRYLPPQQQKILRYIALAGKPQFGSAISRNCFIDVKSLSKQLSELTRKNLIETIQDKVDRRNKLYDINDPLLRISIEVGEHKEGITALFVDFLALFYSEDEPAETNEGRDSVYRSLGAAIRALAANRGRLTKADLAMLRTTLVELRPLIPEIAVPISHIDVYAGYFLNDDKNALYELPKEQRLFFAKHILQE
jgi:DNA-binding MarR family transcriptional regulator